MNPTKEPVCFPSNRLNYCFTFHWSPRILLSDRAALAGGDYTVVSSLSLTFDSVLRTVPVGVSLITDDVFELTESFSGVLSLPNGPIDRLTLTPESADAFICDDNG